MGETAAGCRKMDREKRFGKVEIFDFECFCSHIKLKNENRVFITTLPNSLFIVILTEFLNFEFRWEVVSALRLEGLGGLFLTL